MFLEFIAPFFDSIKTNISVLIAISFTFFILNKKIVIIEDDVKSIKKEIKVETNKVINLEKKEAILETKIEERSGGFFKKLLFGKNIKEAH